MTTTTLTDTPVERDAEGFFVHPEQWTEDDGGRDRARERHRQPHRPPLAGHQLHAPDLSGDRQRAVDPHARQGLGRPDQGALPLFPKGPAKLAAKIAGIPKPRGCI